LSNRHSILLGAAVVVLFALPVFASPSAPCWFDGPQAAPLADSACVDPVEAPCDAIFLPAACVTAESEGIEISHYVENVVSFSQGEPESFFDNGSGATVLASVPGTLALTIIGFAFVTLVRNRRTWARLAVAAYLIAEAGASLLPGLADRVASSRIIESAATALIEAVTNNGRRVWATETCFAGLLRRLEAEPAGGDATYGTSASIWQMMMAARGVCVAQAAFCVVTTGGDGVRGEYPCRRA
jgi:hypothetical protein